MKLVNVLVLSTLLSLSTASCATTISSADLKINNQEQHCIVEYAGASIELQLTPPCMFVQDNHGEPEKRGYPDFGLVFIVTGKPASAEYHKDWNVKESDMCSDKAQHFIIGQEVKAGKTVLDGSLFCPKTGLDEIFYRDAMY